METVFAKVAKHPLKVSILRSFGRGDGVCEFLIRPRHPDHQYFRVLRTSADTIPNSCP